MTLVEIYKKFSEIALEQPNIRTVILNDVYKLNEYSSIKYGVFAITQQQHYEEEGFRYYALNLFVVDRLLEHLSNDIDIQSSAIEVLHNIIRTFVEDVETDVEVEGNIQYQSFTQRFTDECAGVYASLTLRVPIDSLCGEEYE